MFPCYQLTRSLTCLTIVLSFINYTTSKLDSSLGLNPSNLHRNGIAFGALPGFKEPIKPNTPEQINSKLSRPISIMGDYIHFGTDGWGYKVMDWHLKVLEELPGNPVYQVALMPVGGLYSVTEEMAERIADKMLEINQRNITVWLRWCHEMNGGWYVWGHKPSLFKRKWRMVARAVKNKAPDTYMMWAPNARYGDSIDSIRGGYTPYWPGTDFVDIAALSFYHFGGSSRRNTLPEPTQAVKKLKEFSKLYGMKGKQKAIVIAETSAPYTRYTGSGWLDWGNEAEEKIKLAWLKQVFSAKMKREVPELKAVSWVIFQMISLSILRSSLTARLFE
ncbi:glycoside hydrolase superfamily [Melampsora americana]|nr:glycoside hydrolase superfamily [Melampsora americana]